ncbi:zinc finger Ran-binding domain-containing protein [Chthoniobacter flavus]|nr:Ran-binding zinc finger domain-containing protein [Chthoniobacter flavus]
MSTESHPPTPSPEGVVCPKCLFSNSATAAFCAACGAPIGMVANVDPLQHIYAEGFGYRSAVDGPPKLIILIGMWLLFGPLAVGAVSMIIAGGRELLSTIPWIAMFLCSIAVLYRVTRNYIVKSRLAGKSGG